MSVEREEVRRVATLARLRLEADELARLTVDLNSILEHVDALRAFEPSHPVDGPASTERLPSVRSPEAEEPDPLLDSPGAGAPAWRDGFFLTPPLPGLEARESEQG